MAARHIDVDVRITVKVDPAGDRPTWWGRLWLALSILVGRPVMMGTQINKR